MLGVGDWGSVHVGHHFLKANWFSLWWVFNGTSILLIDVLIFTLVKWAVLVWLCLIIHYVNFLVTGSCKTHEIFLGPFYNSFSEHKLWLSDFKMANMAAILNCLLTLLFQNLQQEMCRMYKHNMKLLLPFLQMFIRGLDETIVMNILHAGSKISQGVDSKEN